MSYSQYDILVFNETWLSNDINSAELQLFDYNIYRKDRSSDTSSFSRGGGVLIAVRKIFASTVLSANNNIEQLFVKIETNNNKFILSTVYFPPRSAHEKYLEFAEGVENLYEEYPEYKLCILRDFNFPNCRWANDGLSSLPVALAGAPPNEAESIRMISVL